MLQHVTHVNVWVRDHDEALAFYIGTLGMEIRDPSGTSMRLVQRTD
jgi:catechol 2,3-dioxygenase-like lactoylglutathione lyase family enzyme